MSAERKMPRVAEDWRLFQEPGQRPPAAVASSICTSIRSELDPALARVVAKIGAIHFLTSLASLSICPQFGVRLYGEGHGMMGLFMPLGEDACALACGLFFLGTSVLAAALLLSRPEWRKVRAHFSWMIAMLLLPSFAFFAVMEGHFAFREVLYWMVGAVCGGVALMELAWRFKAHSAAPSTC